MACSELQACSHTDSVIGHADKSLAILEASGRERLRGHGGRKHSGQPGGMSVPRRRRAAAEAAKRMRWVTKMQVSIRRNIMQSPAGPCTQLHTLRSCRLLSRTATHVQLF